MELSVEFPQRQNGWTLCGISTETKPWNFVWNFHRKFHRKNCGISTGSSVPLNLLIDNSPESGLLADMSFESLWNILWDFHRNFYGFISFLGAVHGNSTESSTVLKSLRNFLWKSHRNSHGLVSVQKFCRKFHRFVSGFLDTAVLLIHFCDLKFLVIISILKLTISCQVMMLDKWTQLGMMFMCGIAIINSMVWLL